MSVTVRVLESTEEHPASAPLRTLVVGAGEAGKALARDLGRVSEFGLEPIGFLDDDPHKKKIRGLLVLGTLNDMLQVIAEHQVDVVVLAIPGLSSAEVRRLATVAARMGVGVRHLPSFVALLQRQVVGTDLRDLNVATLIGRSELRLVSPAVGELLRGKRVLVTGAGGSIGSELCRQVEGFEPDRLFMLDHDESNLHRLQLEVHGEAFIRSEDDLIVADIRDAERMAQIMADFRPHVVLHAAALKHLPMLERHPCEGVKSNVAGTDNVLQAALDNGVERFVLISTDKAADPCSVLGATKALAEQVVRAKSGSGTAVLSAVRFGNVLGSRGSLLSVLAAQLREGGDVTITHPEATRFFMTIEEAVGLVLESMRLASGGETFVLDMGEPVRIVDLVDSFARQLGIEDVAVRFTGLRPGEKLHESLFSDVEDCVPTGHPRIMGTRGAEIPQDVEQRIPQLYAAAGVNDTAAVHEQLTALVPSYRPAATSQVPVLVPAIYPDDY